MNFMQTFRRRRSIFCTFDAAHFMLTRFTTISYKNNLRIKGTEIGPSTRSGEGRIVPSARSGEGRKRAFHPGSTNKKSRSCDRLIALVGISGFEPEQTEPKSVVLPLHHIPIPRAKIV